MSASEALTIWMLSTAMKAPSVAPITATQVLTETAGAAGVAGEGDRSPTSMEAASMVAWSAVMGVSSRLSEDKCIERSVLIIDEKMQGLSGQAWRCLAG